MIKRVIVKATSERDLPTGVYKALSGKRFVSRIKWGGTRRYIGTFDTTEQASAVYTTVRNVLNDVELSVLGGDEVVTLFNAAQTKAVEAVGGFISSKRAKTSERDLPTGVFKTPSGKFQAKIQFGGKQRHIGCLLYTSPSPRD